MTAATATPHAASPDGWKELAGALSAWHQWVAKPEPSSMARADRAELRRAATVADVERCIGYFRAIRTYMPDVAQASRHRQRRVAAAVGLLACVESPKPEEPGTFMARVAGGRSEGELTISPPRMRRLLDCEDVADLFVQLKRILPLVDRRADAFSLASDILCWGEAVRRRWAYAYPWPTKDEN